jgi:hypothetical protein
VLRGRPCQAIETRLDHNSKYSSLHTSTEKKSNCLLG